MVGGMGGNQSWKQALYESYVSSGQAGPAAASALEQFRPRRAYLRWVIRRLFPADRGARILDIGCGHGALLYFLREAGYANLAGVDSSPEQVALAHTFGIESVACGDAMAFLQQQPAHSAQVICLFDVLEHLDRQELFDLLAEVRRVLVPGGSCIGHVPNAAGLFGMRIRYGDLTHEQAFTATSLRQAFRSLGFTRVDYLEDKPVVHGPTSLVRRVLWEAGSLPFRLLLAAESADRQALLSQNLLFRADLPS